jgi:hypothetical protein
MTVGGEDVFVANKIQRADFSLPNVNRFNVDIVFPTGAP